MRRYHPDADQSEEAASHSRAINIAYATLGDPTKREAYDFSLGIKSALKFDPIEPRRTHKGWPARIGAAAAIFVALIAAGMIAYAVFPRGKSDRVGSASRGISVQPAKALEAPQQPRKLPPPPQLPNPEQPVVTPMAEKVAAAAVVLKKDPTPAKPKVSSATAVSAAVKPEPISSKCSGIARRPDRMVCDDENLASLERQTSLLYRQSWAAANERKRVALLGTRQVFNNRREECENPNCLMSAYVGRLKEISDIMAGRQP